MVKRKFSKSKKVELFIKKYLPKLKEKYNPEKVILFGSSARGDILKHSDLDLIIVSKKFEGMHWLDRGYRVLVDLKLYIGCDLLCYTPEEFKRKKKEIGIVRLACREGVELLNKYVKK